MMSPLSKDFKEVRDLGITLLVVGLGALVLGVVLLLPRPVKKTVPPQGAEPKAPESKVIDG